MRWSALLPCALLWCGWCAPQAKAADALVLEVREVRVSGMFMRDMRLRLTPELGPPAVPASAAPTSAAPLSAAGAAPVLDATFSVSASAASLSLGGALGSLTQLHFDCSRALQRQRAEPSFACHDGHLRANSGIAGELQMNSDLQWRSDSGKLTFSGKGQKFAGGTLAVAAVSDAKGWQLQANSEGASVAGLRKFAAPWLSLPASIESGGSARLSLGLSGRSALDDATAQLQLTGVSFGNTDATVAGEHLRSQLLAVLHRAGEGYDVRLAMSSDSGQALAGPVLLDFTANPQQLSASGRWQGEEVTLGDIHLAQRDLLRVSGQAVLRPAGKPYLKSGRFLIEELSFPAAYSSFLQIALAAGDFGTLTTAGRAHGKAEFANDSVSALDMIVDGVDIKEQKGKFAMQQLRGELHWLPAQTPAQTLAPLPAPSWLTWQSGSAYGLSGGATRLDFRAQGLGFELTKPARVPVFDGALRIDKLAAQELATSKVTMQFAGEIEPISMPRLAKAFGWPDLAGQLAGKIPRVEYRDKLLTFTGDVEASVFDGRVTGSKLRLKDPLGPWPRLYADVRARDLDLALVTSTFSIGSISGRLEADILGLELFNWSPVTFDAALRTPPGDRGRHRISAKAVGDLSNIGGGGGGVVKALQSGAFKLFDEYDYARLGLRCKLDNEVCLMSGVEPAGVGYYILQGKGLPHIDIVGNAGRVNWPQLVAQIGTQMRGEGKLRIN